MSDDDGLWQVLLGIIVAVIVLLCAYWLWTLPFIIFE